MKRSKIYEALLETDITPLMKFYTYDEIASIFKVPRSTISGIMDIHRDKHRESAFRFSNEVKGYAGAWMDYEGRRAILSLSNDTSDTIVPNNINSLLDELKN